MRMIPKKPAPDLIRGGSRFSDKIMRNLNSESKMRVLFTMASLLFASAALAASSESDFQAALNAATAAEQQAGVLKNQWTTTEDALAAAGKAAAAGDFDTAITAAQHAEALAKASIAQAKEQETAWRAGVIR
jgi:hypothetical protein